MAKKKKLNTVEPICNNCLCYDRDRGRCKVAILIEGRQFHMPVDPGDRCHMDELQIPVEQVRWWVEDKQGKKTNGPGKVKMEYPEGFFGEE